jgi:hypothetical protein
MNNIWCFGDSFTAGHGCTSEFEYYQKYKKEGDKLWCEYLGNILKMNVINKGINGGSNDMIIDSIIDSFNKITADDIVIIEKTFNYRYDIPNLKENNKWVSAHDIIYHKEQYNDEQYQTIINFSYHFANHNLYKDRQNKRIDFISNILQKSNIKVFMWDIKTDMQFYDRIKNSTNGEINDGHLSFSGHHQFYQWIYQKLIEIL